MASGNPYNSPIYNPYWVPVEGWISPDLDPFILVSPSPNPPPSNAATPGHNTASPDPDGSSDSNTSTHAGAGLPSTNFIFEYGPSVAATQLYLDGRLPLVTTNDLGLEVFNVPLAQAIDWQGIRAASAHTMPPQQPTVPPSSPASTAVAAVATTALQATQTDVADAFGWTEAWLAAAATFDAAPLSPLGVGSPVATDDAGWLADDEGRETALAGGHGETESNGVASSEDSGESDVADGGEGLERWWDDEDILDEAGTDYAPPPSTYIHAQCVQVAVERRPRPGHQVPGITFYVSAIRSEDGTVVPLVVRDWELQIWREEEVVWDALWAWPKRRRSAAVVDFIMQRAEELGDGDLVELLLP